MSEIQISEIFVAPQGEGPDVGRESVFVRTHGCPVRCSWCDTAYTWDGSEHGTAYTAAELVAAVEVASSARTVNRVVLTGGEPLVSDGLARASERLLELGFDVEIETSTAAPLRGAWRRLADHAPAGRAAWNLSPKMPSARPRIQPSAPRLGEYLKAVGKAARFKVVIDDDADWTAWTELFEQLTRDGHGSTPVWVSPQARTAPELMAATAWLIDKSARSGFRVSPRQHIMAFGAARAR